MGVQRTGSARAIACSSTTSWGDTMLSILPVLLLSVNPAQAAWSSMGSKYDCAFAKQDEGDVVALKADCTWTEPADKVEALLGDWSKHGDIFDSVVSSEVVGTLVHGKGRVHQVHQASGITDREVFIDVAQAPISGGMRYTHTKAEDQSGILRQADQRRSRRRVVGGSGHLLGRKHGPLRASLRPGRPRPGFHRALVPGLGLQGHAGPASDVRRRALSRSGPRLAVLVLVGGRSAGSLQRLGRPEGPQYQVP